MSTEAGSSQPPHRRTARKVTAALGRGWRGFTRAMGDWRWVGACSVLMLVGSVGFSLVVLVQDRNDARAELSSFQDDVDDDNDVSQCRSQAASVVTDKQVDYLLSLGDLVISLPSDDPTRIGTELQDLGAAGEALSIARDARLAFEQDPRGDC